jgi:hypothetical protein
MKLHYNNQLKEGMKTKTFKTKLAAMLLMALAFSFPVKAQVTIGSGIEPQRGALLDVKSKDAATPGGETTDQNGGGILMPRVELVDINSLEPFIAAGDQDADTKANHKGLVVYNLTATGGFAAGPYSWDGTKWVGGADANDIKDYTGSTSIILDGNAFKRAALEGDVTASADSNATLIAIGAVNSDKIKDGSILGSDIADSTIPASKLVGSPTAGMILTTAIAGESPSWLPGRSSYYSGNTVYAGNIVLLLPSASIDLTTRHLILSGTGMLLALTIYKEDVPKYTDDMGGYLDLFRASVGALGPSYQQQPIWFSTNWNTSKGGLFSSMRSPAHRLFILHAISDCVIDNLVTIGPY